MSSTLSDAHCAEGIDQLPLDGDLRQIHHDVLGSLIASEYCPIFSSAQGKNRFISRASKSVRRCRYFNAFGFLRDAVNEPLDRSSIDDPERNQIIAEVAPLDTCRSSAALTSLSVTSLAPISSSPNLNPGPMAFLPDKQICLCRSRRPPRASPLGMGQIVTILILGGDFRANESPVWGRLRLHARLFFKST